MLRTRKGCLCGGEGDQHWTTGFLLLDNQKGVPHGVRDGYQRQPAYDGMGAYGSTDSASRFGLPGESLASGPDRMANQERESRFAFGRMLSLPEYECLVRSPQYGWMLD